MSEPDRTMLSFLPRPDRRFQMRAAAIIRRDGHLLIHKATQETFWTLPGGRVEFGETGEQAVQREIAEELGCSATIGPLRYLVENFFIYEGETLHEIGWYYDAKLTGAFPFITDDICHRATEGSYALEFRWVPCGAASFGVYPLMPPMLAAQLTDPTPGFRHIVERQ